jgi:hypothetical protein
VLNPPIEIEFVVGIVVDGYGAIGCGLSGSSRADYFAEAYVAVSSNNPLKPLMT